MKKLLLIGFLLGVILSACKKEPASVSTIVTPSYPTVTLNGPAFISLSVGGAYTDAGATGTDDLTGASGPLTPIINTVDASQAGFYTVVYEMRNGNGYKTRVTRFVLVTGVAPSDDWSGFYQRNGAPNRPANVAKIGTGLYSIDNVGGVILPDQAPAYAAYIGFVNDSTIEIPEQVSPTDNTSVVGGSEGAFYITATDTIMQWKMTTGPFNPTALRVFYKFH